MDEVAGRNASEPMSSLVNLTMEADPVDIRGRSVSVKDDNGSISQVPSG